MHTGSLNVYNNYVGEGEGNNYSFYLRRVRMTCPESHSCPCLYLLSILKPN